MEYKLNPLKSMQNHTSFGVGAKVRGGTSLLKLSIHALKNQNLYLMAAPATRCQVIPYSSFSISRIGRCIMLQRMPNATVKMTMAAIAMFCPRIIMALCF